jgi:ribonuclease D
VPTGAPVGIRTAAPYGDGVTDEPHNRRREAGVTTDGPSTGSEAGPIDGPSTGNGHEPTAGPTTVLLTAPRDGTPTPVTTPAELEAVTRAFANGHGPVAVDAERASGYRYTHRAYLVQLRRAGAGTVMIDPTPFADLRMLADAISDAEWVLHAASQDLPCLAELGMLPTRLFDTELAARITGFERVGLAALTETLLGYALEKHHSAADWSTRPLPQSWLTYAALDVELLLDLRQLLSVELERQGKTEWAAQEFAALVAGADRPPRPRPDPWRRTSGIHRVRGARALARVRALWYARDRVAARRDASPGRVLSDAAIIAAAEADPRDERSLQALAGFTGRSVRRLSGVWLDALEQARALGDTDLPTTPLSDGPPPPHRWAERDPAAAARLARSREVMVGLSTTHRLPPENVLAPDFVRRLAWSPPHPPTPELVGQILAGFGARRWQIELTAQKLAAAVSPPTATKATPEATPESDNLDQ